MSFASIISKLGNHDGLFPLDVKAERRKKSEILFVLFTDQITEGKMVCDLIPIAYSHSLELDRFFCQNHQPRTTEANLSALDLFLSLLPFSSC